MSNPNEWGDFLRGRAGVKNIEGVTGVGLAGPHAVAYVKKVTPEILRELPEDINGIPLTIKEVGTLRVLPLVTQSISRVEYYRPVPGGVSVGHWHGDTGTHGCAVKYGSKTVGISNCHVAGLKWGEMQDGRVGDTILQPGLADLDAPGTEFGEVIKVARVPPKTEGSTSIDAAIYSGDFDESVLNIGVPAEAILMEPGMRVVKSGRTTGLTSNTIETIGAVVDIEGYGVARFENVAISKSAFSMGGDSGSLVTDLYARSCGLVFAGSDRATVICEATEIEKQMGVTFGFGETHVLESVPQGTDVSMPWIPVLVGGVLVYLTMRNT